MSSLSRSGDSGNGRVLGLSRISRHAGARLLSHEQRQRVYGAGTRGPKQTFIASLRRSRSAALRAAGGPVIRLSASARSRQDARAAVSRRGASPNWQELPRSAIANCEDRLKRSAKPCRENPAAALGSAFRWIAFVPLYRCRALLAGPVHDNKEARKHRPTA